MLYGRPSIRAARAARRRCAAAEARRPAGPGRHQRAQVSHCGGRRWVLAGSTAITLESRCPLRPTPARNASASCARGSATSPACAGMLETPFYIACLRLTGPALPGRRRRRGGAGEGRGTARLRRRRDPGRARGASRSWRSSPLEGSIVWERREYQAGDLDGCLIAIAATDDTDVNIRVFEDAERRAMLVNVVDVPPLCNFILPAIVRTGPLAVAISTAGASPALAKRMKREIAELFGEPYADAGGAAQRRARLGQGDAADLPGPQGVLRGDRQRRARPDRAAARRRGSRACAS